MSDWSDGVLSAPSATGGGNFMDMLNPSSGLMKTGLSVLGSTLQAAPSSSSTRGGTVGGAKFDSSGMNVNFGSGGITSSRSGEWAPESEALIALAVQYATLENIKWQVENRIAELFVVRDEAGQMVMAFVLRVDENGARGDEGVIVAAGGDAEGVSLTDTMIPVMENMFKNCASVRIHTARPGLWRLLVNRHGYKPQEMVLTKDMPHG
jgi:hypothetical protein